MPPASPDQSTKPQGATSLAPRRVGLTDFGDLDMGSEGALCPDSKGNADTFLFRPVGLCNKFMGKWSIDFSPWLLG